MPLTQFHEDARILRAWRAWTGPALRWLTPLRRRWILAAGAAVIAVQHPLEEAKEGAAFGIEPSSIGKAVVVLLLLGFLVGAWALARRFKSWPALLQRHPQVALHGVFWLGLVPVRLVGPDSGAWRAVLACALVCLPFLLWRVGYMLMSAQRGKLAGSFVPHHLFYLWPAYGGSDTPHGKGPDYLASCEAQDEEALAKSQLAGLRLLALGLIWSIVQVALDGFVLGRTDALPSAMRWTIGLPRLHELLEGRVVALPAAWCVLYLELFHDVLRLASKGHLVIGVLRLFGFNAFRNTYKPLLAESVVEFWNRFFYYFKELMAQFFFFPVFARHFKSSPRLRMFAAVFAAAFVGNMYYHLIREAEMLVEGDAFGLWLELGPRLLYCLLLALGIYWSMRREQARAGQAPRTGLRRVAAIFAVWSFFAVIHVWAVPSSVGLGERTRVFVHHILGVPVG